MVSEEWVDTGDSPEEEEEPRKIYEEEIKEIVKLIEDTFGVNKKTRGFIKILDKYFFGSQRFWYEPAYWCVGGRLKYPYKGLIENIEFYKNHKDILEPHYDFITGILNLSPDLRKAYSKHSEVFDTIFNNAFLVPVENPLKTAWAWVGKRYDGDICNYFFIQKQKIDYSEWKKLVSESELERILKKHKDFIKFFDTHGEEAILEKENKIEGTCLEEFTLIENQTYHKVLKIRDKKNNLYTIKIKDHEKIKAHEIRPPKNAKIVVEEIGRYSYYGNLYGAKYNIKTYKKDGTLSFEYKDAPIVQIVKGKKPRPIKSKFLDEKDKRLYELKVEEIIGLGLDKAYAEAIKIIFNIYRETDPFGYGKLSAIKKESDDDD